MFCLDCDRFQKPEHFTEKNHKHREVVVNKDGSVSCFFLDLNKIFSLLGEVRVHPDGDKTRVVIRVYDSDSKAWYSFYENKGHARGMGVKEVQNKLLAIGSIEELIKKQFHEEEARQIGACELVLIGSHWIPYQDIERFVAKENS